MLPLLPKALIRMAFVKASRSVMIDIIFWQLSCHDCTITGSALRNYGPFSWSSGVALTIFVNILLYHCWNLWISHWMQQKICSNAWDGEKGKAKYCMKKTCCHSSSKSIVLGMYYHDSQIWMCGCHLPLSTDTEDIYGPGFAIPCCELQAVSFYIQGLRQCSGCSDQCN